MTKSMLNEQGEISFADREVQLDPFPVYDRLREERPVYHDPGTGNYVLTRYEDVRKALLNVKALKNSTGVMGDRWCPEANAIFAAGGWAGMDTLVSNDPPSHRFYRALVDKVFTSARVSALEPRVEEIIDGLLNELAGGEEFDFLEAFAVPLPMFVIAEQLGVDPGMKDVFKLWSDIAVESTSPIISSERQIEMARILVEMQQYFAGQMDRVRAAPDATLLSRIVNTETDGRTLDDQEVHSLLFQVLTAGNETTTTTLASGMKTLIEHPELAERLHDDPARADPFLEEVLRTMTPLQCLWRRAAEDVEIAGVTIPQGALVEMRFGSANRDPQQFACPAHVDLDRKNARSHLAFGAGIHLCIGNQLARAELRLGFQAVTRRFHNFRVTRGADSLDWMHGYAPYGLRALWMAMDPR